MGYISGVLTTAQGSDQNILTSIWQYIYTNIKTPYDIAAAAAGLNQGTTMNKDGTYIEDALGLGIVDCEIDEESLYKRAPTIGYCLDCGRSNKAPRPTGAGDGANDEWRNVLLKCVPAVTLTSTSTVEIQTKNRLAKRILKTAVWDAIGRSFVMPLVDSTQPQVNNLYPQCGFAYIESPLMPKTPRFQDALIEDARDFHIEFTIRFAVLTADGL